MLRSTLVVITVRNYDARGGVLSTTAERSIRIVTVRESRQGCVK